MNPLLTALNSNGGRRGGSQPPLSTARPGLALQPPKREALAWGGERVERRTGEENVNLGLSPCSFEWSPSSPWQSASAPPVHWPWRWQLAPGPDRCAFVRQPRSLSGGSWVARSREQGGEWGAEVTVTGAGGGEGKEEIAKGQGSEGPSVVSRRRRRKGWWKCLGDHGGWGWGGLKCAAHFHGTHMSGPSWGKDSKWRSLPLPLPLPRLQQTTAGSEPVPGLPRGRNNTSRTSACPGSNLEAVSPKITQAEPGVEISSAWLQKLCFHCKLQVCPPLNRTSQCGLHASSSRGSIVTWQFIRTAILGHHSRPTWRVGVTLANKPERLWEPLCCIAFSSWAREKLFQGDARWAFWVLLLFHSCTCCSTRGHLLSSIYTLSLRVISSYPPALDISMLAIFQFTSSVLTSSLPISYILLPTWHLQLDTHDVSKLNESWLSPNLPCPYLARPSEWHQHWPSCLGPQSWNQPLLLSLFQAHVQSIRKLCWFYF